ncbi:leucine-rich repeat-containing protein 24-like isoform X1 [Huso huso]|uniref:Leucine-rich repeat-containing protein 24-like isoform X1 n=1 Tax=Huso huso TaxID=61971 RepID=A0ABR1A4W1_HUSHU
MLAFVYFLTERSKLDVVRDPASKNVLIALSAVMGLRVLLCVLALQVVRTLGCPTGCRCYSLTVECGSIGLREIPADVPPTTQTIFLQDNSIGQIRQQDLSHLGQLHYLYLQNNSISALEPGAFHSQQQLLELALNGNRIHLVSGDVFQGLEHLRILYLAGNQITRLHDFTFRGLQRLQELHLQENSVELLGEQALAGLSSLALLDLSRNNLRTLSQASLRPLASLQVLRVTDNPWRCDCALHWLRSWINEEGQRLLSSAERRLVCAEPPRLSHQSLVEVPGNSLVCIPPVVQLEPKHLTVRLGENVRVSCQASGYPQPLVTWRKVSQTKASPKVSEEEGRGGTMEPSKGVRGNRFDPDTGSGMLFLSNVTVAHVGRYECEAWNPGGVARVTFDLSVNLSSSSSQRPYPAVDISQEPLYDLDSMDFNALSMATQTTIAIGISMLALTALLLIAMIYSRHRHRKKGPKEESILYVNDYSDGPTTFAQLEEYRDERGHEMYVLNRSKPVFPASYSGQQGELTPEQLQDQATQTVVPGLGERSGEEGERGEEALFINQSLMFDTHIAYEIHC